MVEHPFPTLLSSVLSTGAFTFKAVRTALAPTFAPLSTWPQPVFSDARSGGDLIQWEPTASATPTLVIAFTDDQTVELVVYINTRIAASTTISATYAVV